MRVDRKALFALSFGLALTAPAVAQAAPGASVDMAGLSLDLQTNRNSAASIYAKAEEIRQLKALALQESGAAVDTTISTPVEPDVAPSFAEETIPTGNGLVPARNKKPPLQIARLEEFGKTSSAPLLPASAYVQGVDLN